MAFKMKGWSAFKLNDDDKKVKKFDIKGYLKGKQGLIPDYKGKSTKQSMNESKLLNPVSADEHMSDMMDSKQRTRLLKDQADFSLGRSNKKFTKEDDDYLKHYIDKSKKKRPNRKDRY